MAVSLENYAKKCKVTQGGIIKAYIFPFVFHKRSLIKDDGMSLIEFPNTTIFEFDTIGNYNQSSSVEDGAVSFEHSVNLQLSKVYDTFLDINQLVNNDFRVIVETNNKQLIIFGTRNGMSCSASNATGQNKSDFNGFSLDFRGKEEKTGLLISSLEDLGFTVFVPNASFQYTFDFNF